MGFDASNFAANAHPATLFAESINVGATFTFTNNRNALCVITGIDAFPGSGGTVGGFAAHASYFGVGTTFWSFENTGAITESVHYRGGVVMAHLEQVAIGCDLSGSGGMEVVGWGYYLDVDSLNTL